MVGHNTEREHQGTQLELINQELQTMLRRVRSARGSAEAIVAVLRGAIIAKVAYCGGLSQWSLDETRALDTLFAKTYRQVSKNMPTSQEEALFQPSSMWAATASPDYPTLYKTGNSPSWPGSMNTVIITPDGRQERSNAVVQRKP